MKMLVIAEHPGFSKTNEGMMQRVTEIDRFLRDEFPQAKIDYLKLVIKDKREIWLSEDSKSRYFILNMRHNLPEIMRILKDYDYVYIHSLYNYIRIASLIAFSRHKVIIDLHGVVPEEEEFYGRKSRGKVFGIFERLMILRANLIIGVTQNMIKHFKRKYNLQKKYLHLPIFDNTLLSSDIEKQILNKKSIVIYAGGLQPWQNLEMILSISDRFLANSFKVECYISAYEKSLEEEELIEKLKHLGIYFSGIRKTELYNKYRDSSIGILLRDDMLINQVSSPTKLNEYLAFGIVPLIIQSNIGDFSFNGYKAIYYKDIILGTLPTKEEIMDISLHNLEIYKKQIVYIEEQLEQLARELRKGL